ncbi:hypothetical protein JNN96_32710 [Mycobacterium sp. DSM 3803]|nr:hypothetical protein [Mycobacterium sp. DSM 3803]
MTVERFAKLRPVWFAHVVHTGHSDNGGGTLLYRVHANSIRHHSGKTMLAQALAFVPPVRNAFADTRVVDLIEARADQAEIEAVARAQKRVYIDAHLGRLTIYAEHLDPDWWGGCNGDGFASQNTKLLRAVMKLPVVKLPNEKRPAATERVLADLGLLGGVL